MKVVEAQATSEQSGLWRSHIGIPIRNLWLLLTYAADLAQFLGPVGADPDDDAELPEILARVLVTVVQRRLRRSLSRGYEARRETLSRVRGRIDWLETTVRMHLQRGRITCRFDDFTFDTPRNRFVRAALVAIQPIVRSRSLAEDCRRLAQTLGDLGVYGVRPTVPELVRDVIATHQADDRLMVAVARLALDLIIPSETGHAGRATRLERDEALLRQIFEKAVAGFYRHELHARTGWTVAAQSWLSWHAEPLTEGVAALLPGMRPDLVLTNNTIGRSIVLDTKFTNALSLRPHGGESFKSEHIYQIYAYLSSQSGRGSEMHDKAEGLLLYPTLNGEINEIVKIQNHIVCFKTIDLAGSSASIIEKLRDIVT